LDRSHSGRWLSQTDPHRARPAGRGDLCSKQNARAASSHTGALAGDDEIPEDVFKQSGEIRPRAPLAYAPARRGRAAPACLCPTDNGLTLSLAAGSGRSGAHVHSAVRGYLQSDR